MRLKSEHHASGFTLIEIVITLTVTAVLSTMIFTFFGKAFTESVTPIVRLKSSAVLQRVMENITADYNVYPKWRSETDYTTNTHYVIPTNFNGFYYLCTTGGKSYTSEPTIWPQRSGATITDNTVTWTWSGRLRTLRPLTALKTSIGAEDTNQDNTYGKYYVVKNRFTHFVNGIDLDSDDSGANANKILKVTLRNDSGETQTALFVSD
ncbi:MAG: prepilin-type N-terminal cleavage/methylation domain-containing protein [Desulfobacterales bacterium]|jgi:prepilin-type N-terminal cleavage/methylation domain-containing protein|nr:prepilin-type N-terminal cleavage/methylation domain-containing protein [Desulfobacterales bacterium]